MFNRIFGIGKKKPLADPAICFGRYSDNNKPASRADRWKDAEALFAEGRFPESLEAFFDYVSDPDAGNVLFERNGVEGRFRFYQGSKIVRGSFDGVRVVAEVSLARMPQPTVPVMRRLLEMNFNLYYSRYALDGDRLCMKFDSDLLTASPAKLYYGLKELATRADKQDDLLLLDFSSLQQADTEHMVAVPEEEKAVKYRYFLRWIDEALEGAARLDADKQAGGIAYLFLSLVYRIDYLLVPEGWLLQELEKINAAYFNKEDRPVTEKNRMMREAFQQLRGRGRDAFDKCLVRSRHTFSIVAPQPYKAIVESIQAALQNMVWYRDNGHPDVACRIAEYGISFCQYSYSLPRVVTELFQVFMQVNHADFFRDLGFHDIPVRSGSGLPDPELVKTAVESVETRWKNKYAGLAFDTGRLRYEDPVLFCTSYLSELASLQLESAPS